MISKPFATALLLIVSVAFHSAPDVAAQQRAAAQKPAARTPVKPSLAKAKLAEATAAAKRWKADAVLIQISGRNVGPEGTTLFWDYGFYSRSAKTCAIVNVARATTTKASGGPDCEGPELTEFIDSDRAATIAWSSGITKPAATMVVSVVSPAGKDKRAIWSVYDDRGMKSGDVMLDVDAQTGAVLNKTTQR